MKNIDLRGEKFELMATPFYVIILRRPGVIVKNEKLAKFPPHPNAVKHFFPMKQTDLVAEVVRLRKRLFAKARILTNPATKKLHSVALSLALSPPLKTCEIGKLFAEGRGDSRKLQSNRIKRTVSCLESRRVELVCRSIRKISESGLPLNSKQRPRSVFDRYNLPYDRQLPSGYSCTCIRHY